MPEKSDDTSHCPRPEWARLAEQPDSTSGIELGHQLYAIKPVSSLGLRDTTEPVGVAS